MLARDVMVPMLTLLNEAIAALGQACAYVAAGLAHVLAIALAYVLEPARALVMPLLPMLNEIAAVLNLAPGVVYIILGLVHVSVFALAFLLVCVYWAGRPGFQVAASAAVCWGVALSYGPGLAPAERLGYAALTLWAVVAVFHVARWLDERHNRRAPLAGEPPAA